MALYSAIIFMFNILMAFIEKYTIEKLYAILGFVIVFQIFSFCLSIDG